MDDSIGILRQMLAGHEKHAALAEATGSREVEYHRNRCRALRSAIAALDAAPVMYVTHDGKHGEYSTGQTSDARDVGMANWIRDAVDALNAVTTSDFGGQRLRDINGRNWRDVQNELLQAVPDAAMRQEGG